MPFVRPLQAIRPKHPTIGFPIAKFESFKPSGKTYACSLRLDYSSPRRSPVRAMSHPLLPSRSDPIDVTGHRGGGRWRRTNGDPVAQRDAGKAETARGSARSGGNAGHEAKVHRGRMRGRAVERRDLQTSRPVDRAPAYVLSPSGPGEEGPRIVGYQVLQIHAYRCAVRDIERVGEVLEPVRWTLASNPRAAA